MQIHTSITNLNAALDRQSRIAFAPTMGNLHEGHLSLMRTARQYGDTVVASIFVNRLQFGPNEDFDRYPRTFENDCALLSSVGVDHLFAPDEQELYPQPQRYQVYPAPEHESILEGATRPGHFRGVTTVVSKLFNIVRPQVALFGKKDYQQLMILRNMVCELNMPIEMIGCEIVRAADGLALSSRNGYLSAAERQEAPRLNAVLQRMRAQLEAGYTHFAQLENAACDELRQHGWVPDYISVRRQLDLQPATPGDTLVIVAAARLGNTRLIDNVEIAAL
ncbi:pantoate--beta-alanine ligase [Uliginosibacterium gangwonense]|uniref:pantoate--beta-alanine ligase n=1 Tax=Uliginosibacterium gangwonense TaxID=392736 RepID=UPI00037C171D|nr:pantoate--beta-alanine ligase [Uliginosibacterium gangwonense]